VELGELLEVGWRMLSTGGRPPVEATGASLALVTVLDADELGAVGCTISEEGGRPPVEATTVGAATVGSSVDVSTGVLEVDSTTYVLEVVDSVLSSLLAVVLSDVA